MTHCWLPLLGFLASSVALGSVQLHKRGEILCVLVKMLYLERIRKFLVSKREIKRKPGLYDTDDIMLNMLYLAVMRSCSPTALVHHCQTYHSHDMDIRITAPRSFLVIPQYVFAHVCAQVDIRCPVYERKIKEKTQFLAQVLLCAWGCWYCCVITGTVPCAPGWMT